MRPSRDSSGRFVEVHLRRVRLVRRERAILKDVSWSLLPGQRWVLVGRNGAGKTQLLKLISGALWPTPGGRGSRHYRWRAEIFRSPFEVKDEIGYIGPERQDKYERYGWNHTVAQVVGTGLYRTDIPLNALTSADRRRIAAILGTLGIKALARRRFLSLSYGERRLTLLARALAARPKLLLMDELFSGLDATNRERALGWLEKTGHARLPWVLATHRIEEVPRSATHALVLEKGRVIYRGPLRKAPLAPCLSNVPRAPRHSARHGSRAPAVGKARSRVSPPLISLEAASVFVNEQRVLDELSLRIGSGEIWVVHGANGSGKTTLLRTLYGDHRTARPGRIRRAGLEPGMALEQFRRKVGLVAPHLQSEHPQRLTVAEVVQSGRHASIGLSFAPTRADRAAARRTLAQFGLSAFSSRTLGELSYGQLRRVLFARAWVRRPKLLLLDEPFAGVDSHTREALMKRIQTLARENTTVVMATHHRKEWPTFATHELQLSRGRAVYCGPVRMNQAHRNTGATR